MNICTCFGPSWVEYVEVELHSLFKTNKVDKVYLMSEKLTEEELKPIYKLGSDFNVKVTYIDMQPFEETHIKSKKNVDDRFTKYTLYRLGIPDFIPEDRVLYLDADALVVGNIEEFYNTPFDHEVIAGCIDTGITARHMRLIKANPDDVYLNAGVLLMDLKKMREMGLVKKWITMMNQTHYPAHDQDIIHLTLAGKFKVVPPIYNCSLSTSYKMSDDEVRIVHYAGDKRSNWVYSLPKSNLWADAQVDYQRYLESKPSLKTQRINKIIAYGWFGKGPKPPKIQQCIESWKKFCPDWNIVELNEDNCNVNELPFVAGAFRARKFAFVADYFRLKAMYDWGCVTLDADVELIKPIDCFLHHRFFSGQEIDGEVLITATMGGEKGHPVVKDLMSYYETAKWRQGYNIPNTRWITTKFKSLIKYKDVDGSLILKQGVHLYPKYYFCNYDHKKLELIPDVRSYAIHHFNGSWK